MTPPFGTQVRCTTSSFPTQSHFLFHDQASRISTAPAAQHAPSSSDKGEGKIDSPSAFSEEVLLFSPFTEKNTERLTNGLPFGENGRRKTSPCPALGNCSQLQPIVTNTAGQGGERERRLWRMKRPESPMRQGGLPAVAWQDDYAELWKHPCSEVWNPNRVPCSWRKTRSGRATQT